MRIVWISIFLFVVVVMIFVGSHDPDETARQASLVPEASTPAGPFVENNNEAQNRPVELAALPAGQPQTGAAPTAQATANNDLSPVAQTQAASVSTTETAVERTDTVKPADNADAPDTAMPDTVRAAQKKSLGLLARSIEQQNNENKVAVIVHPDNNQRLTKVEIRAIYQDRITQWRDGSSIMLYNLPLGDEHREKFSQDILDMPAVAADAAELNRKGNQSAVNSGQIKAKNVVVAYVERDPNAIAYVPLSMIREKSNVKVVMTIP
ncbi:MAG TPA: hypothetical protein VIM41_05940 [Gammaproteobacteria bacterium]